MKKANIEHWFNNVNSLSLKLCINDSVTTKTTIIIITTNNDNNTTTNNNHMSRWTKHTRRRAEWLVRLADAPVGC